jgi:hypothetical protein
VYLTADSENELTDFVANEIYVIGGIVDRNRHKNLTLNKAKEQGIRHARLPIQKHLALSGTHVLTVNQVVDIILAQLELKNWDLAMEKAVPMRKHAKEEPGNQTVLFALFQNQSFVFYASCWLFSRGQSLPADHTCRRQRTRAACWPPRSPSHRPSTRDGRAFLSLAAFPRTEARESWLARKKTKMRTLCQNPSG